mgnify:CR=1 FL=1
MPQVVQKSEAPLVSPIAPGGGAPTAQRLGAAMMQQQQQQQQQHNLDQSNGNHFKQNLFIRAQNN